ncbi:unnamed protein product, partial [Symbiodinium microadriaticum]
VAPFAAPKHFGGSALLAAENVACNNLGGQGPGDSDEPAELRFRRAGFVGDRPVDVVIQ